MTTMVMTRRVPPKRVLPGVLWALVSLLMVLLLGQVMDQQGTAVTPEMPVPTTGDVRP